MSATSKHLLFLVAERFPTHRVDVAVLFGACLPKHGISSDIVAMRAAGREGAISWAGGRALLCRSVGAGAGLIQGAVAFIHGVRQLWQADSRRYDAIQVRDMPITAVFALALARLRGLPFFYWMSFPRPEGQILLARDRGLSAGLVKFLVPWLRGRIWRLVLYRWVLPRADHVFVQSERMKSDMVNRGIAQTRMTAVPMGVDIEAVQADSLSTERDPRLDGRRVLVYMGTQDRPRHVELLFDVLRLVRQRVPEAILVMIGDTQDASHRQWLRQQASEAGVADHVVWTGWLPTRRAWGLVRGAEVGLSPFPRGWLLDSASPTKVPEYIMLGVPVVCNDNPDQRDLVQAAGCGICVPYTASAFSEAVIALMEADQSFLKRMIETGQKYIAENRDYSVLSAQLARTYADLLRNTAGRE